MSADKDTLLILKSSTLGDGEPDLGEKLLVAFLTQLLETGVIPARIICLNSGVFLTTGGSAAADLLQQFSENGSTILSCGTCLEYYGRTDKLVVGEPTNMRDTVEAMLEFKRVLQP